MKKRLNFARSLLLDAPLDVCDEPTRGGRRLGARLEADHARLAR
jgi:ABC-type transporter Mla maintaining outer membrane lipid asymmetry ATPase subunit MlaF